MPTQLFYVADPMCSWCWGFAPVLGALEPRLREDVSLRLVLGGLAPDSDQPMDEATLRYVQQAWRNVEARTGVPMNHAFWSTHHPRRSTWPACRAVLTAAGRGREMFAAIQRAYYTEARDPSDPETLTAIAGELGLDQAGFAHTMGTPAIHARLAADFELRDRLGVTGYPSVAIEGGSGTKVLTRGWVDAHTLARALGAEGLLKRAG